jgi:hypothetical protein
MMTAPEPDGTVWHTSSYSNGGDACVEIGWRTSSYSNGGDACVEVAPAPDAVLVRDSKNRTGPTLTVPSPAFLTTVVPNLAPWPSSVASPAVVVITVWVPLARINVAGGTQTTIMV